MDPLVVLRSAFVANLVPRLVLGTQADAETTDDVVKARGLVLPPVPGISEEPIVLDLDEATRFEVKYDDKPTRIDTRTVYNCWLTRELSVTDYIAISDERGILNLKFLERTDLITWLEGASSESSNIVSTGPTAAAPKGKREVDPELQKIYAQERALLDHNRILHGSKSIDFSSVSSEARHRILAPMRNGAKPTVDRSGRKVPGVPASTTSSLSSQPAAKRSDPIILLSPSASALLNMTNVKQFLEQGVFSPTLTGTGASNLLHIQRTSDRIGTMRFVVVDSVDRFKPEYWDRVVAVFVTGQPWQLKAYQWSDPNVLFQKVLGLTLAYRGDPLPPTIRQWNISIETVERNQRFRDREVVERIWERIEQSIISKGWAKK